MDEIQEKKQEIRAQIAKVLGDMSEKVRAEKTKAVEDRLFEFANFLEANIALLYMNSDNEVATRDIIKRSFDLNKIVVLPAFHMKKYEIKLMKVDHVDANLRPGPRGVAEPDPSRCKTVPIDCIDIAIIPGIAFDEKGARIGMGTGFYDRLIPDLPITTRKVALTFEEQIIQQVPMEHHDKHVDIIISDKRIIYKI